MVLILVILSLSLLILGHEFGHFIAAKWARVKVEEFGIGFPPRLFKKKKGETIYSINAIPFGGFVKMCGEHGEFGDKKDEVGKGDMDGAVDKTGGERGNNTAGNNNNDRSFSSKSVTKRSVIILSGVAINFILGWFAFSAVFMSGVPQHLLISDVAVDSPAESVGIKQGDIILRVGYGDRIFTDPVKLSDLVELVKIAGVNEVSISVLRGEEQKNLLIRGRENPPEGQGSLGVGLLEIGFESESFFRSFISGAKEMLEFTVLIISGFFMLITKVFVSPEILDKVAGPVGIVSAAKQAGDMGFVYFIQFFGLISVNLAVLNLLPFPALDGGRFIFLLVEKIKGSPISARFQTAVNVGGLLALLVLMVLVTIQDVSRLFN